MTLNKIRDLLAEPFAAVNHTIETHLSSDVPLVSQLCEYIIEGGGKRLRPLLHLLSALAADYQGLDHIRLAAVIEFIHTATLLHDDVVDDSTQRRGKATANTVFGNAASVLVGDFLYSRAFQMMVSIQNMRVMDILSYTTNVIAEGEVLQLMHRHNADIDQDAYFHVIACKTAKLFEAATRLGGVLANGSESLQDDLAHYGFHTGMAFQIIDDVLDYSADPATLGKNLGDDLAEGKMTLPLLYAMETADQTTQAHIRHVVESGGHDHDLAPIQAIIKASGALDKCRTLAHHHVTQAQRCLQQVPSNIYRQALFDLAGYAIERSY